jgi:hypothetical protein
MIHFNDASLHGQFSSCDSFKESLKKLWEIRNILVSAGLHLRVCRGVRQKKVTPSESFDDFLGAIPKELRARLLLWLDREGPFWDDDRRHSDAEYLECCGEVVTDTGVGEAAYLQAEGMTTWLFSLDPSKFLFDPLAVQWLGRQDGDLSISIPNGWDVDHAQSCVTALEKPFTTWGELLAWAKRDCSNLLLSPEIESHLPAQFFPNVAKRSKVLLGILDKLVGLMKSGNDAEAQRIRNEWMQGERARFSPSSESELSDFASELTFRHPVTTCSWHGKIQTPQFRIHYEWPIPEGEERLFVAYIGPKITKR